MRLAALVLPFAFLTSFAVAASADVPSGKCHCSLAGASTDGALAGAMLGGGGLLLLLARGRQRR
jgi:hypothetical protein